MNNKSMQLRNVQKIAIIGCAGSGKTWLTLKLQEKLHLPIHHLDQYYWLPGWQPISEDKFIKIHHDLCLQQQWIIEGIYSRYMPERFEHADLIIFLDIPRYQCLWNVLWRAVQFHGKLIPGVPVGCEQNIWDYKFIEFLQWIWNFPYRSKPKIEMMLNDFIKNKPVIVLRSRAEINGLIDQLS